MLHPTGDNLPTPSSALAMKNNTLGGSSECQKRIVYTTRVNGRIPEDFPLFKVQCQANKLCGWYTDSVLYLKRVTTVSSTNPKEEWKLYRRYLNKITV